MKNPKALELLNQAENDFDAIINKIKMPQKLLVYKEFMSKDIKNPHTCPILKCFRKAPENIDKDFYQNYQDLELDERISYYSETIRHALKILEEHKSPLKSKSSSEQLSENSSRNRQICVDISYGKNKPK